MTRITSTLHVGLSSFVIISRSVVLRMRNVSDEVCGENRNTHFMFSNFFPQNRTFYETMWKSMLQPDSTRMTIIKRGIHFAC
jgi:hypothetical protein